jgi:hypothetical protein
VFPCLIILSDSTFLGQYAACPYQQSRWLGLDEGGIASIADNEKSLPLLSNPIVSCLKDKRSFHPIPSLCKKPDCAIELFSTIQITEPWNIFDDKSPRLKLDDEVGIVEQQVPVLRMSKTCSFEILSSPGETLIGSNREGLAWRTAYKNSFERLRNAFP